MLLKKIDDVGMVIYSSDKDNRSVLKYSPNAKTVWPTRALGYTGEALVDFHEALNEVMQDEIIDAINSSGHKNLSQTSKTA